MGGNILIRKIVCLFKLFYVLTSNGAKCLYFKQNVLPFKETYVY